jgi:small subunit ribosomal protein S17
MRNIGINIEAPKKECDDPLCPFHGNLPVRGRILEGVVIKDEMKGAIVIRRDYHQYVPKYLRYERRRSHIVAHNPPCIDARVGDTVKIIECRPLSKSISFVAIEKKEEKSIQD